MSLNAVMCNTKTDNIKSWSDISQQLRNNRQEDKRTDEEIEAEVIARYNKAYGIKEV